MLSQKQKLHITSVSAISLQIVTIVCGFILPRFLLQYYGSAVNGLISSITQFLGFITLAECGIGAVVQSALYKPLSCNDYLGVSRIIVSAEHFYRNIAKI
ncbi:sugar isomerase, partial [Candidatus Saccharibacteria bacterium]|nr:sugar isomerase [Candidatus Saccharibacteria bacterium]